MGVLKASEASAIIKQTFKLLPTYPMMPFDEDEIALKLVSLSYSTQPGLFDGKMGHRPHARATAAISLAGGLTYEGYEFPHPAKQCVFLTLGNVLLDAAANAIRYRFSVLDVELIRLAEAAYLEHDMRSEGNRTSLIGSLGY